MAFTTADTELVSRLDVGIVGVELSGKIRLTS